MNTEHSHGPLLDPGFAVALIEHTAWGEAIASYTAAGGISRPPTRTSFAYGLTTRAAPCSSLMASPKGIELMHSIVLDRTTTVDAIFTAFLGPEKPASQQRGELLASAVVAPVNHAMTTAFCRVAMLAWVDTAMLLFAARAAVDRDGARLLFDEAQTLCERDAGALR